MGGWGERMAARPDDDRALAVVRNLIREWDSYSLIAGGAPSDEWDGEIAAVVGTDSTD